MFSKGLEDLIKATLEDGILEDYEKEALIKRAQKEGVDLTELEIYINSLLQKRKRELKKKNEKKEAQYEKEKKEAIGPVCPKCGKQVPPLTLKCECGYEFTKGKAASSVQQLAQKIEAINNSKSKNKEEQINNAITLFPVPNTKEDIVEFLALSAPNARKKGGIWGSKLNRWIIVGLPIIIIGVVVAVWSGTILAFLPGMIMCWPLLFIVNIGDDLLEWNRKAEVWRNKFDQVLMKGRSLMGDPDFQRQLDYYEKAIK